MSRALSLLSLLALGLALAGCARPRRYIELVLDTDLPQSVALKITIRVVRLDRVSAPRTDGGSDAPSDAGDASDARTDSALDARTDASLDGSVMDARVMDAAVDARSDSGTDGRSDVLMDARDGAVDSGAISLVIDPSVSRQEYQRTNDGGISLPASLVFTVDPPYEDRVLVEVRAESSSAPGFAAYSWTQHAVVRPSADGPTIVRMVLSYHCAFPVMGCGSSGASRCNTDAWCRERGLTCGEDGVCIDPSAVSTASAPTRRPSADACAPGRCDPWCPPCPSGTTCGPNNACVRSASRGCVDNDGDGYGEGSVCLGRDCDDARRDVSPASAELCDRIDNDCNGMIDEQGICGPFANSTCPAATAISLMAQRNDARLIDTAQGSADLGPRCRFAGSTAGAGKELWYSVTWPANEELDARLERVGSSGDPVLLVFDRCPDAMAQPLVCNDDSDDPLRYSSRVVIRPSTTSTAPRTLYFAADSYGESSSGPMRLNVTRRPAAPAASCAAPYDVGIGGAIYGLFGGRDGTTLSCTGRARVPDETFSMTLPADSSLYVRAAQPTAGTPLFLGAGPACGMVVPDRCVRSDGPSPELIVEGGSTTVFTIEGGAAGTPYVLSLATSPAG